MDSACVVRVFQEAVEEPGELSSWPVGESLSVLRRDSQLMGVPLDIWWAMQLRFYEGRQFRRF